MRVGGAPPRRYYTLSAVGTEVLGKLTTEWQELVGVVATVLPQKELGKENKEQ